MEDYLKLKIEINKYSENNIISMDKAKDNINNLEQKIKLLKVEYQTELNNQIEKIKSQLEVIEIATTNVNNLFKDEQ